MKFLSAVTVLIMTISSAASANQRESYYVDMLCPGIYGGTQQSLPSGLRPDCQTELEIMEFDWATRSKIYECIGQSLIYAQQSGKTPMCVLLARNPDELELGLQQDFEPFGIILDVIDVSDLE